MARFYITTFGCKTNQYESAIAEAQLREADLEKTGSIEKASYIVLNTCAVTERAERDALKLIRKIRKQNPKAVLILAGCFSQRDPAAAAAVPGVDYVVGNAEKTEFVRLIRTIQARTQPKIECADNLSEQSPGFYPLKAFSDRTRAFLKIQEGCNNRCAYCIVPSVRGRSRSVPREAIMAQISGHSAAGYREIVLTGIHIGQYEMQDGTGLLDLLREAERIPAAGRLRLTSLECAEIGDDFISFMRDSEKMAPHLHVPLQSGSAAILKAMNRPYTPEAFAKIVEKIHREIPSICIGTDIIAGFPGEGEGEFAASLAFLKDLPFSYAHIFTFSPRPGTPAAAMPHQVSPWKRMERSRALRREVRRKNLRFRKLFLGKIRSAVVLNQYTAQGEQLALTDNYIRVKLREKVPPGSVLPVRIDSVGENDTRGFVVQSHS